MAEALDDVLDDGTLSRPALCRLLRKLVGSSHATGRWSNCGRLATGVYRLRFQGNRPECFFVAKRLQPATSRVVQLLVTRWLPALGLSEGGPPLLGVAAEPDGQYVWHVYEDLGDRTLDEQAPDLEGVRAAVAIIGRLHTHSAGHPLLPECRMHGGDRGAGFYGTSIRDAHCSLHALRPPAVSLSPAASALRNRLLGRLDRLLQEESARVRVLREAGGPDVLLHGDLWPKNVVLHHQAGHVQARLIDWDRAGVGPISYDLSTFLGRFPICERSQILDLYREAVGRACWRLPPTRVLNQLAETAECARLANCLIWRALAVWEERAEWALHDLELIEEWLEKLQPLLPPG